VRAVGAGSMGKSFEREGGRAQGRRRRSRTAWSPREIRAEESSLSRCRLRCEHVLDAIRQVRTAQGREEDGREEEVVTHPDQLGHDGSRPASTILDLLSACTVRRPVSSGMT
jgi:hypothetical protein